MADVEMNAKDAKKEEEKKEDAKTPPPPPTPLAEIKSNAALIDKAVSTLEPRFTHRVLKSLTALRRRTDATVLRNAVEEIYPKGESVLSTCRPTRSSDWAGLVDSATRKSLLSLLPGSSDSASSMDIDSLPKTQEPVPEVEIYLRLLIIYTLLNSSETYGKALQLAQETGEKILQLNRRSMDPIAAKVWYAVDRAYELGGELADARPYAPILPFVSPSLYLSPNSQGSYFLPSVPHRLDMTMNPKQPSSTAFFATISNIVSSTKQTNSCQRPLSRPVRAILSMPGTTTTLAASRSSNSTTLRRIEICNKLSDVHLNQKLRLVSIKPCTSFSLLWSC